MDGMGASKVDTIIKQVTKCNKSDVETALIGLKFHGVGKRRIKAILDEMLKTRQQVGLHDFMDFVKNEPIENIQKIGNEYGAAIREHVRKNEKLMEDLMNLIRIEPMKKKATGAKLSGQSFCVTGGLASMGRSEFKRAVENNGGEIKGVSKKLSFLVTNDTKRTGKLKAAEQHNIPIINERAFLKMIDMEHLLEDEKSETKTEEHELTDVNLL
jgi:DNA ligase (NAD+)